MPRARSRRTYPVDVIVAARRVAIVNAENGSALEAVESDGVVELRDPAMDSTVLARFVPTDRRKATDLRLLPAAQFFAKSLAEAVPAAQAMLTAAGKLTVEFTPAVQRSLQSGTLRLMQTQTGAVATAVDRAGHFVEHGRVVQTGASVAIASAAPILLLGMASNAMAAAQMARIERSIAHVQQALSRIEHRAWDNDIGRLQAAASLAVAIRAPLMRGRVGEQLRIEAAVTATGIDTLYFARRRTSSRLLEVLEARAGAWGDPLKDLLEDESAAAETELFIAAAVARAGLLSARAGLLALDGDHEASLELTDLVEREIVRDGQRLLDAIGPFVKMTAGGPVLREFVRKAAGRGRALGSLEKVVAETEPLRAFVLADKAPIRLEVLN